MLTRRLFSKLAAAIPAAVALPATAAAPGTPVVADAAADASAAEKYPWRWWVSTDGGERYFEQCSSREEAIEVARGYGRALIAECRQGDFPVEVTTQDAEILLETISERTSDLGDPDGDRYLFDDVGPDQTRDLSEMMTATLLRWVEKHGVRTTAWAFADVTNEEYVNAEEERADV